MTLDTIRIGHGDFGQAGKGGYAGSFHSGGGWGTFSGRRIRIDPANPADAFNEAMDRIAGKEATLHVSAGSAAYDFNAIAVLDQPCTIIFDRNAQVTKETTNRTCFQVAAPGVSLIGLRAGGVIDASAPTAQSYVEILSTASEEQAADCLLEDCVFDVIQNAANVQGFFSVRALGFGSTAATRGPDLRRCIQLVRTGTQSTWAWVGEETSGQGTNENLGTPYGCGLLFAKSMRDMSLTGCKVMGKGTVVGQYSGVQILLEGCLYTDITGLRMSDFSTVCASGVDHAAPLIVVRGVVNEGGHMSLNQPFVEAVTAKHLIAAPDPQWINVYGGEMGRTGGHHLASAFRGYASGGPSGSNSFRVLDFFTHNVFGITPAGVAAGAGPVAGALTVDFEGIVNPLVNGCSAIFRNDAVNPYRVVSCTNQQIGANWHEAKKL
jgi:hypothetical protein